MLLLVGRRAGSLCGYRGSVNHDIARALSEDCQKIDRHSSCEIVVMHTCQQCGFEAQAGARFCRQCGAPLFVEREETLAQTRRQASAGLPSGQPYQSNVGPQPASPETMRFGRGAEASFPVAGSSWVQGVPPPAGSSGSFWVLISAVCLMAAIGLLSAVLIAPRARGRRAADRSFEAHIERQAERAIRADGAARRASEDAARLDEEIKRKAEESARAAAQQRAPVPPSPPGVRGSADPIEDLIFPDAENVTRVGAGNGPQVVRLTSRAKLADIASFYSHKLGPPTVSGPKKVVFIQDRGGANTVITLQTREKAVQITIARTPRKAA